VNAREPQSRPHSGRSRPNRLDGEEPPETSPRLGEAASVSLRVTRSALVWELYSDLFVGSGAPAVLLAVLRSIARKGYRMLIGIRITFLVIILVLYLVNLLPIDGRAKQIVRIVVIVIGVLSLLRYLGYGF
jgi:hypothetical protein